ncbi:hypothetical protein AAE478_008468 [Parahypoxylon ruwenzoriense]
MSEASVERRTSNVSTAELARRRDLNKYYQPWLDSKKLKTVPTDTGSDESRTAQCSHDTTLTALAQLAALRLRVKRGVVSLIDANTQIILAEATQTISLVDASRHAPGDHIWLGNVSLPRQDCMDEYTFGSTMTWKDAEGQEVEVPILVVNDTLEDDRFKSRPYVTSGAGVRFYAGVPIVTKQGHAIGVYAAADTEPRPQGLTLDEALYMRDVAQIIADHLKMVMDTIGRVSERDFIRGISYFLEDLSIHKYQLSNADRSSQTPNSKQETDIRATDSPAEPIRGRQNSTPASTTLPSSTSVSPTGDSPGHDQNGVNHASRFSKDSNSQVKETVDSSQNGVRRIFTQASQLICKHAGAAGCVITDAAPGLLSRRSEGIVSPPTSADLTAAALDADDSTEGEDTDTDKALKDAALPSGKVFGLPQAVFGDRSDEKAEVLSVAVAEGDGDEFRQGLISRKHLKKMILRYPFGNCFYLNKGRVASDYNLSADEVIAGNGSSHTVLNGTPIQGADDQPRISLPRELLHHMPDAKWLIFLPLFNYDQGEWFATSFIWGNDFKTGDPEDKFPYFKTFGSCMMSEVVSMEFLNTNIAKSTFIASISHDLRSPLHGMLGSLEFLEDTMTSAYQTSLIGAIETCGKTLLDTIDHLLDYAKINNLNRAGPRVSPPKGERNALQSTRDAVAEPLSTTFDLALLLEEVVEAVFAGQTFRKVNLRRHGPVDEMTAQIKAMRMDDSSTAEEQVHTGSAKFSGKVFLVLNIQKLASWCLQGQTGGLRRVIMNVVGNAIKYCKSGYIDVSLKAKPISQSDLEVEFSVRDTGIGMSRNFLANHLFKAFSQEDSFTPGTGLGLSIASQIVRNMEGNIKVDSEKGSGTHVSISIPMKMAAATVPTGLGSCGNTQEDTILHDAVKVTTGKKVCILNISLDNGKGNYSVGTKAVGERSKLESSITTFCQEWFNMVVVESSTVVADADTSIYIYAEPPPIEYLVKRHLERTEMGSSGKEAALLIICTNAFEAAALRAAGVEDMVSLGRIIEVISQPVGLRKLGKVLLQCLQRVENSWKNEAAASQQATNSVEAAIPPALLGSGGGESHGHAAETGWNSSSVVYDPTEARHRPSIEAFRWKSEQIIIPADENDEPRPLLPLLRTNSLLSGSSKAAHYSDMDTQSPVDGQANLTKQPPLPSPRPYVLLVDDNAINLKLLVTFMRKINLPYAEAANGLEAVAKHKEASSQQQPFDFVLMDLQMPIMDGLEATRQIREFEQQQIIHQQEQQQRGKKDGGRGNGKDKVASVETAVVMKPATIIAITGVGNEAVREEAMKAGMSQFLTKPVKFKALQQLLLTQE